MSDNYIVLGFLYIFLAQYEKYYRKLLLFISKYAILYIQVS
ncbi:hypothetical protein CKA15_083 [Listeria phage cka15]|nr:hypothetical protein PI27_gp003 [Listeria phage WIL-1]WIW77294.1 hypothetical protein CKA15_083 [Listeria phage cka15]